MKACVVVIAIHLCVLCIFLYVDVAPEPVQKRPLTVRTLTTPAPKIHHLEQASIQSQNSQKIETKPVLKQTPNKPIVEKQEIKAATPVAKKPVVKKTTPAKSTNTAHPATPKPDQQKLISMMQNSLDILNTASSTAKSPTASNKDSRAIGKLASEAISFEAKYEQELVLYLESCVSFPEKGDVKLKLTLKREGTVEKIDIIKSTNERNRAYIESILAHSLFPSFGSHFKGETTHTFIITLTSENSR